VSQKWANKRDEGFLIRPTRLDELQFMQCGAGVASGAKKTRRWPTTAGRMSRRE
jgi:hypothetical protein